MSVGTVAGQRTVAVLLPVMGIVFVAFAVIGLALPVLPLHVHGDLGLGTIVVGFVTGSQFAAALLSRVWAGRFADRRGVKQAVFLGLVAASGGGFLYLSSLALGSSPGGAAALLLIGRGVLGVAEGLIITGGVSWGLALAGAQNAGKVIAWVGMAMFAALALGAPVGTLLYQAGGFAAIAMATTALPLATLVLVRMLPALPPVGGARPPLMRVARLVWLPGLGSALSSVGFGTVVTFGALLSQQRAWTPVWLPFSGFAAALVLARLLLGHLPDRVGGARIALLSVLVEAAGLTLVWLAPGPVLGTAGAMLAGAGFALVYPGLGIEAVRRTPPQSRGLAMGSYTAFLDLALGLGSPAMGLVAARAGLGAVFATSALVVSCAGLVALALLRDDAEVTSPS